MIFSATENPKICSSSILQSLLYIRHSLDEWGQNSTMKTLNGKIVIKDDIPVSPSDRVNVRIEDVSLMDVASVLIAEKHVELSHDETSPISFSLDYDETKIQESMSYTIRAVIRDKEGKLLWITDTDTPVFTRGGPCNHVNVTAKRKQRGECCWTT
jgi:uncharacterized lipoprotein YbaY